MSSIDERVVEMRFQNGQFEKGIAQSSASLKKLKNDLNLKGVEGGLQAVGKAASNLKIDGIADNVSEVNSKLSVLGVIGASALNKLTTSALEFGASIVNNVMGPLKDGGMTRALNLAQARFQFENLGLDVKAMMEAIGNSVDQTAYSLDQAAVAASSFAASGVPLEDMQHVLTAISNTAAISGAEYSRVADIFTKVAGQGRLMGDDLNRFSAVGINIAADLAKQWGISEAALRKMVSNGEVSFNQLADAANNAFGGSAAKSNETYTGSLANMRSAIARIGATYYDGLAPMDGATGRLIQQRDLFNSLRPVINNVHEALKPLIEVILEIQRASTDRMTGFLDGLDLTDFIEGMKHIAEGIRNISKIAGAFGSRISAAFKKAFPKTATTWFSSIAKGFESITAALIPTEGALNNFQTGFEILFGIVSVVWEVLKGFWSILKAVGGVLLEVGKLLWDLISPFLELLGVSTDTVNGVGDFFEMLRGGIQNGIKPVVEWLNNLRDSFRELSEGGSSGNDVIDMIYKSLKKMSELGADKIWGFITGIKDAIMSLVGGGGDNLGARVWEFFKSFDLSNFDFSGLEGFGRFIGSVFGEIGRVLSEVWNYIQEVAPKIGAGFKNVMDGIWDFIEGISANDVMILAQLAGLVAIAVEIYKWSKTMRELVDSAKGLMNSLSGFFGSFGSLLSTMEKDIKLNQFLKIAAAIGILVGALWVLSTIDLDKLGWASLALAGIAAGLMGFFLIINKITEDMTPAQAGRITAAAWAMVLFSGAILLLASAVNKLSKIDGWALARGLGATIGLLLGLALAARIMSAENQPMFRTALAILAFAASLWILVDVVNRFGSMDTDSLLQGGLTVAAAIAALAGAIALISLPKNNANALSASTGIVLLVAAIYGLYHVVNLFADMDGGAIAKGLSIAGGSLLSLVGLAILLSKFGSDAIAGAAAVDMLMVAVLGVAAALMMISDIPADKLWNATAALLLSITVLGALAFILSDSQTYGLDALAASGGILLMAAALWVIAEAINNVADIDTGKLWGIVLALGVLIGIIGLVGYLGAQVPQVALVIGAVALALGAAAAVLWTASMLIDSVDSLIRTLMTSIMWIVDNAPQIANSLLIIAEGVEALEPYFGTMLKVGFGLLVIGGGAAAAGIGFTLLGIGLGLLALGLLAVSIFGPVGAAAMTAVSEEILKLSDSAWQLAGIGLALTALGTGMILVGIGGLLAATAMLIMSFALERLTPIMPDLADSMDLVSAAAKRNVDAILPLIGMSLGLGAFGLAATGAGIGALLLGAGLVVLGAGLQSVGRHASRGTEAIQKVVEDLAPLWSKALQIGTVATALGGLGIAVGVLGVGMMTAAVGTGAMSIAMLLFGLTAPMFTAALEGIATASGPIAEKLGDSLSSLSDVIASSSGQILAAIMMLALGVQAGLGSLSSSFEQLGNTIMVNMANGIRRGIAIAQAAVIIGIISVITRAVGAASTTAPLFMVAGLLLGTYFAAGIISSSGLAMNAGRLIGVMASVGMLSTMMSQRAAGSTTAAAYAAGVVSQSSRVYSAGRTIGSSLSRGLLSGLGQAAAIGAAGGFTVGLAIANGAAAGINAGSFGVSAAARSMARSAVSAAKAELDVRSPSRVFNWIFSMVTQGSVDALVDGTKDVSNASANMGSAAISSVRDSLAGINDIFDMNVDMSPTIRPVIDMTEVEKSASQISSLLGADPINANVSANLVSAHSATIARGDRRDEGATVGSSGTTYHFEQTINSPKALSTTEIYRNTRNLVSKSQKVGDE